MSYWAAVAYFVSFTLGGFAGVFLSFGLPLGVFVTGVLALVLFAVVTRQTGALP